MTKKESFIYFLKKEVFNQTGDDIYMENCPDLYCEAKTYFEALMESNKTSKAAFTANGKLILKFMQDNKDTYNNLFKAKDIGEQLGISSRTVSGGMRKLVTDGYVEKLGENPVIYSVTIEGLNIDLDQSDEDNN